MSGLRSPAKSSSSVADKEQVLQDALSRQADQMQQFEKLLKKLPGQVRNEQRRRLEQLRFGQDNVMEALNFLTGARSPSASSGFCSRSSAVSKTKNQRRKTSNGSYNGSQAPASPWASSTRTPQRGSSAPSSPSSISRSGRQSPSRRESFTPWQRQELPKRESSKSSGSSKSSRRPTQQSRASSEPRIQPGMVLYRSSSVGRNSAEPSMTSDQLPFSGGQLPRRGSQERRPSPPPPQRTAPGQQLREWEQQARSSGSSGASSRKSEERKEPRLRVQNEENLIPPSALRMSPASPRLIKSTSVPSFSKRSVSSRGDYELDFWERLHRSWTDNQSPQTARTPSRREESELFDSRAMEKMLYEDYGAASSCPSTPAAGDYICMTQHDHGRTHFDVVDHLNEAFDKDTPGLDHHGAQGDDFDGGGFDRNIGHGRRKFSVKHHNHLKGSAAIPCKRRNSGNHGHGKEDEVGSDGMPACIGHGRAKVIDHVKDHLWEGESEASGHGHGKAEMCVGGLDHSIGHGRRKVKVDHRVGWPGGEIDIEDLPAGLSSRDVEVVRRPRDPTHPKVTSFREIFKR